MPRNIVPKNAMKKKFEVEEDNKSQTFSHGSTGPATVAGKGHAIFVGLRACGKTTLGKAVSEKMGREFIDTDELVQQKAGKTIEQIVEEKGWDAFREMETEALADALSGEPKVIATGGGIVLSEQNRQMLIEGGPVFYLLATTLLLVDRLTKDMNPAQRPPLTELPLTQEVGDLRRERDPLYMQVANFVLRAERPPEDNCAEVLEKMQLVEMMLARQG